MQDISHWISTVTNKVPIFTVVFCVFLFFGNHGCEYCTAFERQTF